MTRAVYEMNGEVGSSVGRDHTGRKLVRTAVFWVLWIIPVYWVAMFVDAILFNLIEFWTDDTVDFSRLQERGGTRVALQSSPDGKQAVLTISRNGKLIAERHVVKVGPDAFEMCDADGTLSATMIRTPEGGIQWYAPSSAGHSVTGGPG